MIVGNHPVNENDILQKENCGVTSSICKQFFFSAIVISRISCGEHHVLLLDSGLNKPAYSLYTFGIGNFGELGAGVSIGY